MNFKLKGFHTDIRVAKIANIHYFEFVSKFSTYKDSHPFRELVYVDNGEISVESEAYSGTLKKNQVIIHKENEIHSLTCPSGKAPNVIIIGFKCDCERLDIFSTSPVPLSDEQQKILVTIAKEGRNVFLPPYDIPNTSNMIKRKIYPFGADQMIKIKLEELFISLIRNTEIIGKKKTAHVQKTKTGEIADYIDANYMQNINLDELCFLFGTNKTTLCAGFKAEYGTSVINYINLKRIDEAKRLIREENLNFTEIAEIVGFSSVHYFSKVFKTLENMPPREYVDTIKSKLNL